MNIFAETCLQGRVGMYIVVHNTVPGMLFNTDEFLKTNLCKGLSPRDIQNLRYEIEANEQPDYFSVRVAGFPSGNVAFLNSRAESPGVIIRRGIVRTGEYIVGMHLNPEVPMAFVTEIIQTLNDRDRKCLHFQQRRSVPMSAFSFTFITDSPCEVRTEINRLSLWDRVVKFSYIYSADTNDLLFKLSQEEPTGNITETGIWYDQVLRDGQLSRIVITEVPDLQDTKPFTDFFEYITLRYVHAESIDIYKDKDFTFAYKIIEKHHTNEAFFEEMAARHPDLSEDNDLFLLYPTFRKVLVRETTEKYPGLSNNCVALQA